MNGSIPPGLRMGFVKAEAAGNGARSPTRAVMSAEKTLAYWGCVIADACMYGLMAYVEAYL